MSREEQRFDEQSGYLQKRCPFCLKTYIYFCKSCFFILYRHYLSQKLIDIKFNLMQHSLLCVITKQIFMKDAANFDADLYHPIIEQYIALLLTSSKGELSKIIEESETGASNSLSSLPARKTPSTNSVKSKKSSGILAALVRRNKRKRKASSLLSERELDFTPSSASIFPKEEEIEIELQCQNYEKVQIIQEKVEPLSSQSTYSTTKRKGNFLKKILRRQSKEEIKKKSSNTFSIQTDFNTSNEYGGNDLNQGKSTIIEIPSSYISFSTPSLSPPLAASLQVVQDILNNLRESENYFMEVIVRHIKDENLQAELLDTFTHHFELQWEAERRANALANDMWQQQVEIGKAQESTLQETLNSLVSQNRQLQIDNESLYRKYERLLKKFMSCAETGLKPKTKDIESRMDHFLIDNEKLQHKLETYVRQNESLEEELHFVQRQYKYLEKQFRGCNIQNQNLKGLISRLKTDFELERLSLNYKLQLKEQMSKDTTEAGNVLLGDLEVLKRQLKAMHFDIKFSKFEGRCETACDLVHMSRACINELAKELITLYTQMMLNEKDMENIRETNAKLQENLQKSTTELQKVSKKLEDIGVEQNNKLASTEEKCKSYESEIRKYRERMEEIKVNFENEKTELVKKLSEKENTNKELSDKDDMIEQSKKYISSISAENFALKSQVDSLSKLLRETGAGDMERELQSSHEQAAFYHSRYLEIFDENQQLMLQVDSLGEENRRIINKCDRENDNLKKQLKDLEGILSENSLLKQKLENERHTVQSLQNERMKYLEEKTIFKSIYQHMKAEVSRHQKLEEVVSLMSKEAGHFALVAEYNKKVGDQLKAEVEEKNNKILELRNSVEKLNEIQIKNTKEKLSLCYELSEVCNLKKQTDSILSQEIEKNKALDHSKKELAESTSTTIYKIEEKQKNERIAIKILLKDVKTLFEDKNNLLEQNEKMSKEREEFKRFLEISEKECKSLRLELKKLSSELEEKSNKLNENQNIIKQMKENIGLEVDKYQSSILYLESAKNQLQGEKSGLQESIKYLQNTTQKMQKDLDETREKLRETKSTLDESIEEKELLDKKAAEENLKLSHDKAVLTKEIEYLTQVCDKILCDFEGTMKTTEEKENMFRKELEESKHIIAESTDEIEKLMKLACSKDGLIEKLTNELEKIIRNTKETEREHKQIERKHKHILNEYKNQTSILESVNIKLEKLQCEYEAANNYIKCLEQEKHIISKEIEADRTMYKNHVQELARKCQECEEEISTLHGQLNEQYKKVENEKSAYGTLACLHKEISSKFMKIVKELVEEKNLKQEALTKMNKLQEDMSQLKSENNKIENQLIKLIDESKYYENLYKQCLEKRICLEREISTKHLQAPSEHENMLANCQMHQDVVDSLEKDLQNSYSTIDELKHTIQEYKKQITDLEFTKSEMNLKLHETQRKLNTEQTLGEQLRNTHKLILAAVLQMKERGRVDPDDGGLLLSMVRSSSNTVAVSTSADAMKQNEEKPQNNA